MTMWRQVDTKMYMKVGVRNSRISNQMIPESKQTDQQVILGGNTAKEN